MREKIIAKLNELEKKCELLKNSEKKKLWVLFKKELEILPLGAFIRAKQIFGVK